MIFFPNAKINLGLSVISKRPDGFHNLESVFYPIGWSDILEIKEKRATDPFFAVTGLPVDVDYQENLVYRAFEKIRERGPIPQVAFHLHKQVPYGSGLGGGSSDAAFTLKAMNDLFNLNLSTRELREMAAKLGSDCPFFIDNQPAYVWGKGEQVEAIDLPLDTNHLVVVVPPLHISTARAYQGIQPAKRSPSLKQTLVNTPVEEWPQQVSNDFETTLFRKHPWLGDIKSALYNKGARYASLSGSGSALFGIFQQPPSIEGLFPKCQVWSGKMGPP